MLDITSYSLENKLKKSFLNIKTWATESKTEEEVWKWAQDNITKKYILTILHLLRFIKGK